MLDDNLDSGQSESSGQVTPECLSEDTFVASDRARIVIAQLPKSPIGLPQPAPGDDQDSWTSSLRTSMESFRSRRNTSSAHSGHSSRSSVKTATSRNQERQSWADTTSSTPSRSPSPRKTSIRDRASSHAGDTTQAGEALKSRRKSLLRRKEFHRSTAEKNASSVTLDSSDDQNERPRARKSSLLSKHSSRRKSGLSVELAEGGAAGGNQGESRSHIESPGTPKLPMSKSFSTDRLPHLRVPHMNSLSPLPKTVSAGATNGGPLSPMPKKKDELWRVFRNLDADFTKFASKSLSFKSTVIRTSLLPFLRTHASNTSHLHLRPEDLDRRAQILNKWWTGMVEMLHGPNNQSVTGNDRPVILDALSGMMERPEWRMALPSGNTWTQLVESSPRQSTSSSVSSQPELSMDAAQHNAHNIFVQNLSSQMAFVVAKMSLRNTAASLVTFCGKACAYAFVFVPGMADILGRLWGLQIEPFQRVLHESGVGKFESLAQESEGHLSAFPRSLQPLAFTSLAKYMRKLRTPPPLPTGTEHFPWWGHWVARWSGRDSDLFYVFAKHFFLLVSDFLPSDVTPRGFICAPGVLLVQSQMLANLDSTIHREAQQAQHDAASNGPNPTFDDVLSVADSFPPALPQRPTNAVRSMADNRLVMLIRDFLSESAGEQPVARRLFAQSINRLLQAAVRGVSMFDHTACFTLLGFLEEAMGLLVQFERLDDAGGTMIDMEFWKKVWSMMIASQNTTTELRFYAFIYTVWPTVTSDAGRKADLCLNVLLDPHIFESRFHHWCPMVRAYYMRLLCWRVGRFDGEGSEVDLKILETLLERLQTAWSYFLHLRQRAPAQQQSPSAGTCPSNPAPGRRLIIVRTEPPLTLSSSVFSLEGFPPLRSAGGGDMGVPSWKRLSLTPSASDADAHGDSACSNSDSESEGRGRPAGGVGGFLKNLLASGSRSRSRGRPDASLASPSSAPPLAATGPARATAPTNAAPAAAAPTGTPYMRAVFSCKFSLEAYGKTPPAIRLCPPRLPLPAQQFLHTQSESLRRGGPVQPLEPTGASASHARYGGRALAEWMEVLRECHGFFERRKSEGVAANRAVETPALRVEVFKRPG